MNVLRRSKLILIWLIFLFSCTTTSLKQANSFYLVTKVSKYGGQSEVIVTSDRIVIECGKYSEEYPDYYWFTLYLLDQNNEAIMTLSEIKHSIKTCSQKKKLAENILAKSKKIFIGVMSDALKPIEKISDDNFEPIYFKQFNKSFKLSQRSFQFAYLQGDAGACVKAVDTIEKNQPCPPEDFPIKE